MLSSIFPALALFATASASPLSFLLRQSASTTPVWQTLPATPPLPSPITQTTTAINGVQLWMQKYNEAAGGTPVLMIHGGLGYSAYLGTVISNLVAKGHYVIAVDRRGHGRSTFLANDAFTYDMFAQDTFALLAAQGVTGAVDVVGWSDGAITTLAAMMNSALAAKINRAFLFGASALASDTNATFSSTAIYQTFVTRCATEYATLQPKANFTLFGSKVATLESTLPQFTDAQLGALPGSTITIVGAEHDEAVNLDVPAKLNAKIPGSKLVMLTGVSHFAPLQDPAGFTTAVVNFLA